MQSPQSRPAAANQPAQPMPRFTRRNSMNATSSEGDCRDETIGGDHGSKMEQSCSEQHPPHPPHPPQHPEEGSELNKAPPVVKKSVARLCGASRSKCGYCCGKRLHVLGVKDEYNKNIIGCNGKGGSPQAEESKETVSEATSSKSYGLLFDHLPYGTYEDFINRGWRRSGKHLYRPHCFESCCPSISIRLDVLKFASRCNTQSKVEGSDLAKAVLIRGSKSQRKVGKSLLRALESYNSKCVRFNSGDGDINALSFKSQSSVSNDDSSYTPHAEAAIQLDNSNVGVSGSVSNNNETEMGRHYKKTRVRSPDRDMDKMSDSSKMTLGINSRARTTTPATSSKTDSARQQKKLVDQEQLQPYLSQLSRMVYQVITRETIRILDSKLGDGNNEDTEKPRWAWWNNVHDVDDTNIPKWCSFKVSQQGLPKERQSSDKDCVAVAVSSSACAAASGRSRGFIDKSLIAHAVVDSLKQFMLDSSQKSAEHGEPKLCVKDVSYHEKSGHVHVIIDAPASALISGVDDPPSKCSKKGTIPFNQRTLDGGTDEIDPIAEFITRCETISDKLNKSKDPSCANKKLTQQRRFLTVRSVPSHESSLQPEVHQLFCRYQTSVHDDYDPYFGSNTLPPGKHDNRDYASYQKKNPHGFLDVDAAYGHLNETRRSEIKHSYLSFYRFLGETPVAQDGIVTVEEPSSEDGYDIHIPYGTYHQQYRLSTSKDAFDGPLVAVGVVDILPHCFSSVYAFYDPILSSSLELGKYTALREIEWVRRACQFRPELHYYYLGYYIHSCQKMTYKAEYKPSELLCPVNLKWVDFEVGKKRLEECSPIRHCCALYTNSPLPEEQFDDVKPQFRLEDLTLDIGEKEPHLVKVGMLNKQGREFIDPHVKEFVEEVGIDMTQHFTIKLR